MYAKFHRNWPRNYRVIEIVIRKLTPLPFYTWHVGYGSPTYPGRGTHRIITVQCVMYVIVLSFSPNSPSVPLAALREVGKSWRGAHSLHVHSTSVVHPIASFCTLSCSARHTVPVYQIWCR